MAAAAPPPTRAAAWGHSWFSSAPAKPVHAKTGWGLLASRDGTATKRVWLELGAAAPRALRCADDAGKKRRALALMARVRQVRCDRPCELRLKVADESGKKSVDGAALRFESPAACVAWWVELCRARRAAASERPSAADLVDGALGGLVDGSWRRARALCPVVPSFKRIARRCKNERERYVPLFGRRRRARAQVPKSRVRHRLRRRRRARERAGL